MQDVAPPKPAPAQPAIKAIEDSIRPEIVSGLAVKAPDNSLLQAGLVGAPAVAKDDKGLDGILRSVNKQIKADDNKPPDLSIFKRWESIFVIIVALLVAAALSIAAISAFKQ